MNRHFGFFDLETAKDLFRKLEHDLVALRESGQNSWDAFNFFVTAEHLLEWLKVPGGPRTYKDKHLLLQVVSHIANGAKHFQIADSSHKSVKSTVVETYFNKGSSEPPYFEDGYMQQCLLVHLEANEAKELGSPIAVWDLGTKVVEFFKREFPELQ